MKCHWCHVLFFFSQRSVCESSGRNGQPWTSHLWAAIGWKEGVWLWDGWCCRPQRGSRGRLPSPSLPLVNSLMKKDQSSRCNSGDVLPFRTNPFALSRGCNLETGVWESNSERSRAGEIRYLEHQCSRHLFVCSFIHSSASIQRRPTLCQGLGPEHQDSSLAGSIQAWPGQFKSGLVFVELHSSRAGG